MLKKLLLIILVASIPFWVAGGWFLNDLWNTKPELKELSLNTDDRVIKRPLEKYSIENMSRTDIPAGEFKVVEKLTDENGFTSHKFEFEFSPTLNPNDQKVTTGLINLPEGQDELPLVIMVRGWAPEETYTHGVGTWRGSEFFAQNGFITIAPDFLGYADSDENAADIFESRFQTYTTLLTLLESVDQIERWDNQNIFIWAHSNGGQITLTSLAVTGAEIPTTLWAPVSVFFPYSVLYYTNESTDRGKFIREELAKFEQLYDTEEYTFDNYLDNINAPLQFHQGTADRSIPTEWTSDTVNMLKGMNKEVEYFIYPAADHNLRPDWDLVIQRDLEFFRSYIEK